MGYFEAVLKEIIENNRISRVCPRVARLDVVGPWGGAPAGGTPVLKKNMIRSEPSAMAQPSSLLPDPWWPSQIPAEMDGLSHPPFQYMDIVATHTVGLETPKNLCYMNAILQCLSGTIPLARYFLDESYKTALTESSTTKPVGGPAKVFAETVAGLWGGKDSKIWPGTLVVYCCCYPIENALRLTFSQFVVGRLAGRFNDDSQHDAQEFLEFLLDELDDDLNLNAINSTFKYTEGDKRPSQVGGSPAAASSSQLGRSTPSCSVITDWFQGSLGSSVMCSSCGQARITNDHFMCLSLPIPIGTADELGLDRCLEEFFKTEVLEEEEEEEGEVGGWSCSRCLVGKEATKSLAITKLPHILVVHLKRFTYGEEGGAKIHTLVNSPHRLDLTRYVSIPPTRNEIGRTPPLGHYQLYATCNHAGDLDAGHYTAMVQNLGKGGWNCFDDDTVTSISEEKVVVRLIHD